MPDYIIYTQCILLIILLCMWLLKASGDKEGFVQDSSFVLKQNDEI